MTLVFQLFAVRLLIDKRKTNSILRLNFKLLKSFEFLDKEFKNLFVNL